MAIADLGERITYLNRGQAWVVRKLREMLPRVRDNQLHAELTEMLRSHEANVAFATDVVGRARECRRHAAFELIDVAARFHGMDAMGSADRIAHQMRAVPGRAQAISV
jgi:hypothetical protein